MKNLRHRRAIVFLTGDIHHMSMNGLDQQYLYNISEVEAAIKYMEIASSYRLKVTLFISGKTFIEEPHNIHNLLKYKDFLEIGGHTYNCFRPRLLHYLYQIIFKSFYGPYFHQKQDINKTLNIIQEFTKKPCLSWRTHELKCDHITYSILQKSGVKYISDRMALKGRIKRLENGLIDIPINIISDHNYIYHSFITPEFVKFMKLIRQDKYFNCLNLKQIPIKMKLKILAKEIVKKFLDYQLKNLPFGIEGYTPEKWLELVKKQIEETLTDIGTVTLLVHPACMELTDGMKTFEKLCSFLSNYQTSVFKEVKDGHPLLL